MRRSLELLSPAGNAEIGIEAIKHGADAVYIGPPTHGARKSASNSIADIKRLVDFAHTFNARVYVTVNTLVYDSEIASVEAMIRTLYEVGVDALIVQDMGILRMDIPPIALHASTQCDIRTPEKALFLQEAGFSQLVLARELSLSEIQRICNAVTVPVEVFVHGALCVSYSGRCGAGFATSGRSGNRGECPQICRQKFTLKDGDGKILIKDRYLLSLKDLKAEPLLEDLISAGVSSFKIEGRLKEAGYVKNVTAFYSQSLNKIIEKSEGSYKRSSFGTSHVAFRPDLSKSFNRGFTTLRLSNEVDRKGIASFLTPKSLGESVSNIQMLRPGDGISYFDAGGNYCGALVNGISNGRIIANKPLRLPENCDLRRTSSIEWKKQMDKDTAERTLSLDISIRITADSSPDKDDKTRMNLDIAGTLENGVMTQLRFPVNGEKAQKPTDYRKIFEKLGNTPFRLRDFKNHNPEIFIPASELSEIKRELCRKLHEAGRMIYRFDYRRPENLSFPYPDKHLVYSDNIANRLAEKLYREHGVETIEPALETGKPSDARGKSVMTMKHCPLRETGLCLKHKKLKFPLTLESGNLKMRPEFDCRNCEVKLSII